MSEDLDEKYKDNLLKFYEEFNSNRIDYNTRKWETIKFFTSLAAAFITATVAMSTLIIKSGSIITISTKLFLSILPISAIIVSLLGVLNLRRESRRGFEQEASMFKIEKYLGLHDEIPEDKRWLKGDPCLVPTKHRIVSYGACGLEGKENITLEDWLNARLQGHKFLSIINGVFVVEIGIGFAILFLIFLFL